MGNGKNLILFLTDNHSRDFLGSAGHPVVRTPHLDRLAARGVRFASAYAATVLCCPARAALATGRYPHETGYWDNATMYDGRVPSWHHRLSDNEVPVTAIGKLHFRSSDDDYGLAEEIHTMHVVDGIGSPLTLLRCTEDGVPSRAAHKAIYEDVGPGETDYQSYDRQITERAIAWLGENASRPGPWALIVSYPSPHPPFRSEDRFWNLYPPGEMPVPPTWNAPDRYDHPAMAYLAWMNQLSGGLEEEFVRNVYAGYCGLISQVDDHIGRVMDAIEHLGLVDTTHIIYTSDHGEAAGAHGILGKANLYEHSIGVPLIMAGPDLPVGRVVEDCVSHVDLYPTIVDLFQISPVREDAGRFGRSLLPIVRGKSDSRPSFAEYHAMGSKTSSFMLRIGSYKLIYHVDMPNQLFDLETDPWEQRDLIAGGKTHPKEAELVKALRVIVDPEALDARSKADQRTRLDELGGEENVRRMGSFAASPIPGKDVVLEKVR